MCIIVNDNNISLLYNIHSVLKFGKIDKQSTDKFFLSVKEILNLKYLVNLLNGNLVLLESKYMLYHFLNNFNKVLTVPIVFNNNTNFVSWDNYWLTGYCEVSGFFNVVYCEDTLQFNISFFVLGKEDLGFFITSLGVGGLMYDNFDNIGFKSAFCILESIPRELVLKQSFLSNSELSFVVKYFRKFPFLGIKKSSYSL